jgi:hypothetical protein
MSDAIEGADCMLYGVCLRYKESVNCRLEANYGLQQASLSQFKQLLLRCPLCAVRIVRLPASVC